MNSKIGCLAILYLLAFFAMFVAGALVAYMQVADPVGRGIQP
jgi:hypothetical protein